MKLIETVKPTLRTPSNLETPAYAMNIPFTLHVGKANNAWNKDVDPSELEVDSDVAISQFMDLYGFIATEAFVAQVPHYGQNLQDLTYVANLGVILEHTKDKNIAIVSNFSSAPRYGETEVGEKFFQSFGYNTFVCPHKFEGSADLKHLHDNVYVGIIGQRSEADAYLWMEQNFDMKVIMIRQDNPKLYHLDCSLFPITRTDTLVATGAYDKGFVKALEQFTNVIDVPVKYAEAGLCNSVRLFNSILNASDIDELNPTRDKEDYKLELGKNRFLEDICNELAMEPVFINQSEGFKAGALLSCSVLELNRNSYNFETI